LYWPTNSSKHFPFKGPKGCFYLLGLIHVSFA
jgi:hypothetical protein